jgi:hypothetical protein
MAWNYNYVTPSEVLIEDNRAGKTKSLVLYDCKSHGFEFFGSINPQADINLGVFLAKRKHFLKCFFPLHSQVIRYETSPEDQLNIQDPRRNIPSLSVPILSSVSAWNNLNFEGNAGFVYAKTLGEYAVDRLPKISSMSRVEKSRQAVKLPEDIRELRDMGLGELPKGVEGVVFYKGHCVGGESQQVSNALSNDWERFESAACKAFYDLYTSSVKRRSSRVFTRKDNRFSSKQASELLRIVNHLQAFS